MNELSSITSVIFCFLRNESSVSYLSNALHEVLELGSGHLLVISVCVNPEACFEIDIVEVLARHLVGPHLVEGLDGQLFALGLIEAGYTTQCTITSKEELDGLCDERIGPLFVAQMREWIG